MYFYFPGSLLWLLFWPIRYHLFSDKTLTSIVNPRIHFAFFNIFVNACSICCKLAPPEELELGVGVDVVVGVLDDTVLTDPPPDVSPDAPDTDDPVEESIEFAVVSVGSGATICTLISLSNNSLIFLADSSILS